MALTDVARRPLPDVEELTFLEAVLWVAEGTPPSLSPFEARQLERNRKSASFAHHMLHVETTLDLRNITTDPLVYGFGEVWPSRSKLSSSGRNILRDTLSHLREERRADQRYLLAVEELIKLASTGAIIVRAKANPSDILPQRLDPAYFRNPVTYFWGSDSFVFDHHTDIEFYILHRENDQLERHSPLVSVRHLKAAFQRSKVFDAGILKVGRSFIEAQKELGHTRVLKDELFEELKKTDSTLGTKRWARIYETLRSDFPDVFRPGAPSKK